MRKSLVGVGFSLLVAFAPLACSPDSDTPAPSKPAPTSSADRLVEVVGELRASGQRLSIEASFPELADNAADPFTAAVVRTRAQCQGLLQELRSQGAGAVSITERRGGDVDSLLLRMGECSRRLVVLTDLFDIEVVGGQEGRPEIRRFLGREVLASAIAVLLHRPKLGWLAHEGGAGRSYQRLRAALEQRGFGGEDVATGAPPPSDCAVLLALQPAPMTSAWLASLLPWLRQGGRMLLTLRHDRSDVAEVVRGLATLGVTLHDAQLFNGVREPMSGEVTYGAQDARIVVLGDGMNDEHPVTRALGGEPDALVELIAARAVDLPRGGTVLLATEPWAWEGEVPRIDGKPDPARLARFVVAIAREVAGEQGAGRLAVVGGEAFSDQMMNVANLNQEVGLRLVEWLASR